MGQKVKSIFLSSLALRGRRCFSTAYIFMSRGEGGGGGSYERHPPPPRHLFSPLSTFAFT